MRGRRHVDNYRDDATGPRSTPQQLQKDKWNTGSCFCTSAKTLNQHSSNPRQMWATKTNPQSQQPKTSKEEQQRTPRCTLLLRLKRGHITDEGETSYPMGKVWSLSGRRTKPRQRMTTTGTFGRVWALHPPSTGTPPGRAGEWTPPSHTLNCIPVFVHTALGLDIPGAHHTGCVHSAASQP